MTTHTCIRNRSTRNSVRRWHGPCRFSWHDPAPLAAGLDAGRKVAARALEHALRGRDPNLAVRDALNHPIADLERWLAVLERHGLTSFAKRDPLQPSEVGAFLPKVVDTVLGLQSDPGTHLGDARSVDEKAEAIEVATDKLADVFWARRHQERPRHLFRGSAEHERSRKAGCRSDERRAIARSLAAIAPRCDAAGILSAPP